MNAMLLSAGLGRRMLPLTLELPKPAIPVLGRPIATGILARMARQGVERAVLNLHHLPDAVRALFEGENPAAIPEIVFSPEAEILGTAGGIGRAAGALRGAGPILIHNCDFLSDIDFRAVLERHRASGMAATLVLVPEHADYSTIEIDGDGRVLSIGGRPERESSRVAGRYTFTGCHVMDESLLDRIPAGRPSGIVDEVYRPLAAEGRLGAWIHPGVWWELGSPERYLEGSLALLALPEDRRAEVALHDPVHLIDRTRVALGAGAVLDGALELAGGVAVGLASRLGRGSQVKDSVVMAESWIGPNSRLDRVIVGPGVEVPARFSARECLICNGSDGRGIEDRPDIRREGDLMIYDFPADRLVGS